MTMVMSNIWKATWGACRDGLNLYSRCMLRI